MKSFSLKNMLGYVSLFDDEKQSPIDRVGVMFFLSVLGAGIMLAAWLLVQDAAKYQLVQDFTHAIETDASNDIAKNVDWQSVRTALVNDIMQNRMAVEMGFPTEHKNVEKLVAYYVQPSQIPVLMGLYRAALPQRIDAQNFVRYARFTSFREVTVEIAAPAQFDRLWVNHLEPVHLIYELRLSGWNLVQVKLPLYMLPTRIPS